MANALIYIRQFDVSVHQYFMRENSVKFVRTLFCNFFFKLLKFKIR